MSSPEATQSWEVVCTVVVVVAILTPKERPASRPSRRSNAALPPKSRAIFLESSRPSVRLQAVVCYWPSRKISVEREVIIYTLALPYRYSHHSSATRDLQPCQSHLPCWRWCKSVPLHKGLFPGTFTVGSDATRCDKDMRIPREDMLLLLKQVEFEICSM